jgi:ELWxxDGT repeat protein
MPALLLRTAALAVAVALAAYAHAAAPAITQLEDLTPGRTGDGFGVDYRMQPRLSPRFVYYVVSSPENHLELWCTATQDLTSQRLRVLAHNGKTSQYYPDLLEPRKYISYGSAESGEWWERFSTLPGLTYVNDLWGCTVGDRLFFVSHDAREAYDNTELYVSEGTPESTRLVRDINPGPAGAGIFDLTPLGEGVFFFADDGRHGKEPWYSDGTPEGSVMLADVNPGPEPSRAACAIFPFRADRQVAVMGGEAYFFAQDGSGVFSLWRSDGTPGGTRRVYTTQPPLDTQMRPTSLTATESALYWVMADNCGRLLPGDGLPRQLWRSKGTAEDTALLETFDEFGAHLHDARIHTGDLTAVGDSAYITAKKGEGGYTLWRAADEGTVERVEDAPSAEEAETLGITGEVQGEIVFTVLDAEPEMSDNLLAPWLPASVSSLWRSAAQGSAMRWLLPAEHGLPIPRFAPVFSGMAEGRAAWLTVDAQENWQLWNAMEITASTVPQSLAGRTGAFLAPGHSTYTAPWFILRERRGSLVLSENPDRRRGVHGPILAGLGSQTSFLQAAHGTLFFRVERRAGHAAVFATDGGKDKAVRVFLEPPRHSAHEPQPSYDFTWHEDAWHALHEDTLVRIEPADFSLIPIAPLTTPEAPLRQATMAEVGDNLLILQAAHEGGIHLRTWDGAAKTFTTPGVPVAGARLGGIVSAGAFAVFDTVQGDPPVTALWRTDGTETGTMALREGLGPISAYAPGGGVVYAAEWLGERWRVWQTDGAVEGTREVGEARGSFGLGSPIPMAPLPDGRVALLDTQRGRLRVTNGTDPQDVKTKAFAGGEVLLSELVAWNGHFFWVTGGANFGALRLWVSDGTEAGTRVAHLFGGRMMHGLVHMAPADGALWLAFAASDVHDDVHRELWRYTLESSAERIALSDPLLGTLWEPGGTEIDTHLAIVNGQVLFMHYTVETGAELWAVK